MIPRYHGRWYITEQGHATVVTVRWDDGRQHYFVVGRHLDGRTVGTSFGRNGIRRWLKEVKAEPVDGQQPVA